MPLCGAHKGNSNPSMVLSAHEVNSNHSIPQMQLEPLKCLQCLVRCAPWQLKSSNAVVWCTQRQLESLNGAIRARSQLESLNATNATRTTQMPCAVRTMATRITQCRCVVHTKATRITLCCYPIFASACTTDFFGENRVRIWRHTWKPKEVAAMKIRCLAPSE
jgi:hypothetical protein